jgi:hypothetical protein
MPGELSCGAGARYTHRTQFRTTCDGYNDESKGCDDESDSGAGENPRCVLKRRGLGVGALCVALRSFRLRLGKLLRCLRILKSQLTVLGIELDLSSPLLHFPISLQLLIVEVKHALLVVVSGLQYLPIRIRYSLVQKHRLDSGLLFDNVHAPFK